MFGRKTPEGSTDNQGSRPPSEASQGSEVVAGPQQLPATIPHNQPRGALEVTGEPQAVVSYEAPIKEQLIESKDSFISYRNLALETDSFIKAKNDMLMQIIDQVDFIALGKLEAQQQKKRLSGLMDRLVESMQVPLSQKQIEALKEQLTDELFGFGPLEPLLRDPDVSDIMVNSAKQVYVEKAGKLALTDVTFYDEPHLLGIIQRIVSRVGRRVDESSPMVDARMPDSSRFNAIIPPLALDGSLVSIRKFKQNKMPLEAYLNYGSMSPQMVNFLKICGLVGLNIIVSGGTGSGKTTLLNALSGAIGHDERIITIEDAAELQLQQPHVLRLETRPSSMEGRGEISQRQLVKNALRMRPDRIILGEIRGDEVIDVLSAMNTGHDGSMATIHANNPRDCIARIENLVGMSGVPISTQSLRKQIASAVQLIVQIERQRDGKRRVTSIEELVGMEGDVITTQTLFHFEQTGIDAQGNLIGTYKSNGLRPKMVNRARYYGKEQEVLACFGLSG
jgi:pilus assembly protein CpaF